MKFSGWQVWAACIVWSVGCTTGGDLDDRPDAAIEDAGGSDEPIEDAGGLEPVPDSGMDAPDVLAAEQWCVPEEVADECEAYDVFDWPVLLEAEAFGAGAEFVATRNNTLVVRGGDAPWQVVNYFKDSAPGSEVSALTWRFPGDDWRGLDAIDPLEFPEVFALGCDDVLERCALFHGASDEETLVEIAELPEGMVPRGIGFVPWPYPQVCVFGNGLVCFEPEWPEAGWEIGIPLNDDLELVDLLFDGGAVAIAADGRVWHGWVEDQDFAIRTWEAQQLTGDHPLTGVSALNYRTLVGDDAGYVVIADDDTLRCDLGGGLFGAVIMTLGRRLVVGADGKTWRHEVPERTQPRDPLRPARWCRGTTLDFQPIAMTLARCLDVTNGRLMTATQLRGGNQCFWIH